VDQKSLFQDKESIAVLLFRITKCLTSAQPVSRLRWAARDKDRQTKTRLQVSSSVLEAIEEDKFEIVDDENGIEEGDIPF